MRKFSEIKYNTFTAKLKDIILPQGVIFDDESGQNFSQFQSTDDYHNQDNKKISLKINFGNMTHLFIVMEFVATDFEKLMDAIPQTEISEGHVITILYNQLCALNFIHSANIVHRDLKPGNFLVDSQCGVKICDFGMARAIPPKTQFDDDVQQLQRVLYQQYLNCQPSEKAVKFQQYKQKIAQFLNDKRKERKARKRELTPEIMTRWYRAPEVCFTEKNYGKAVDIWSLGTILVELIYCSTPYVTKDSFDGSNRYIFNGDSSYPLSPAGVKHSSSGTWT